MRFVLFILVFQLILNYAPLTAQVEWQRLDSLANTYYEGGDYATADSIRAHLLLRARATLPANDTTQYAYAIGKLGETKFKLNRVQEAKELWSEAILLYEREQAIHNPDYATCLGNLAILYSRQADFVNADKYFEKSLLAFAQSIGKSNLLYTEYANELVSLYFNLGLYKKSLTLLLELKDIYEKLNKEETIAYANFCNAIGYCYQVAKKFDIATTFHQKAKDITERVHGRQSPYYAVACNGLAEVHRKNGAFDKAEVLYIEAKNLFAELLGTSHPSYATMCNNLGGLYYLMQDYEKTEALYLEALHTIETVLPAHHPSSILIHNNLGHLYRIKGAYTKAYPYLKKAVDFRTLQIKAYAPILTEQERFNYINSSNQIYDHFYALAILDYQSNPQLLSDFYNAVLFRKGIVFASTQKMQRQILASGDSLLISQFQDWKKQKQDYNKFLQMSRSQLEQAGKDIEQAATQIHQLERRLAMLSEAFAKNGQVQSYNWKDIPKKLAKDEALVEIIRLRCVTGVDNQNYVDTYDTIYVAFIVTSKTKNKPEIVILENGNDLDTKYLNFYHKAIKFEVEDTISYVQYWSPIADKLQSLRRRGFRKIYFAPSMAYSKLNLNTLKNPSTNQFLLEEQTIQLISSGRDIIDFDNNEIDLSQNFADYKVYLLGFPNYNLSEDTNSDEDSSSKEERSLSSFQRMINREVVVNLVDLPGTLVEVNKIAGYFREKNISVQTLVGKEATEEHIKSLESPTILHLATHGFFMSEMPQEDSHDISTVERSIEQQIYQTPLIRSGLLLTGCSMPMQGKEDGILTTVEAMNLDLKNTQLVVLSACETGLGIDVLNEGVYGLQRAFQQAGAQTIIMSLWKVSDEATQMLMTYFYQNLLNGNDKLIAFKNAQLKLKETFSEPYYWGAFVMTGY